MELKFRSDVAKIVDISEGGCFLHRGDYWLRTRLEEKKPLYPLQPESIETELMVACVNLFDGDVSWFSKDDKVVPVATTMEITLPREFSDEEERKYGD